jgi:primosomal protein N' (replication factor Y)
VPLAVQVLFPLPLAPLRYLAPFDRPPGVAGCRVAVPWQGSVRVGIVTSLEEANAGEALDLKEALEWLELEPILLPRTLEAIFRLAAYAAAPVGVVLASLIPTGFRPDLIHEVMPLAELPDVPLIRDRWHLGSDVDPGALELLRRQGLAVERVRVRPRLEQRLLALRSPDDGLNGKARDNQRRALEALSAREGSDSAAALAREAEVPVSAVRALVTKGYAGYRDVEAPPPALPLPPAAERPLSAGEVALPDADIVALTGGRWRERLAALLPALVADVRSGGSALVLVPEAHLVARTASLLIDHVPTLMLGADAPDPVRDQLWTTLRTGAPTVLVGTYLSLLAPMPLLRRIVVTEAASASYKMQAGARLFVPTAAAMVASIAEVPLVVSDVLPSPEMLIDADVRIDLDPPRQRIHIADMTKGGSWPLHTELVMVLRQVVERKRQALVLAPRRGFSAALGCPDCGFVAECPNCDLTLRYHQGERRLRCHQCGFEQPPPARCPQCSQPRLGPQRGPGSEWLVKAIAEAVPDVPILRYDRDRRDDLTPLYAGASGIVVGTSSLLRIAPLPVLSLIAVGLLDTHLNVADFRAEEGGLRLLLSLSELSAEGVPLTLVQTFQPDHPMLDALRSNSLAGYLGELVERRRRFAYPPFSRLARVQVTARDAAQARLAADRIAGQLQTAGAAQSEIVGPAPAPLARVRGRYAFQLFLRSSDAERFGRLVEAIDLRPPGAKVRIDVDPREVGGFLA